MKNTIIYFLIGLFSFLGLSNTQAEGQTVPKVKDVIVVDMRNSTFFGLNLGDSKFLVTEILGSPEHSSDDRLYYPSRGISIDIIRGKIHSVYLWLGVLGAEEAFDQYLSKFMPAKVKILKADGSSFTVEENYSMKMIQNIFGSKGWVDGPDSAGYTGIGFNAKSPTGDKNLLLNFEFPNSKGLKGLWLVH